MLSFLMSTMELSELSEQRRSSAAKACENPLVWTPSLAYQAKDVAIEAESFASVVKPWTDLVDGVGRKAGLTSGDYTLFNRLLPARHFLQTMCGRRRGRVCFTNDLVVPILDRKYEWCEPDVIMSLTPMEMWSLRPGTKHARGEVVMAGLGLGWQLVEVVHRRTVHHVTLVEKSKEVVELIWERIQPLLQGGCPVDLIIGDARQIVPGIACDVVLADIDIGFGYNSFPHCPQAKRRWVWGGG